MLMLEVKTRGAKDSIDDLRKGGSMPAVVYGHKEESTPISINSRVFQKLFKQAGETTIIKLSGLDGEKDTLIHDVQFHPVSGEPLHADFYVLEKGKKIEVNIPLEFIGESAAEKGGAVLVKALHEIEIEVSPAELPHHLDVDLSVLVNIGDHITAQDIKLPPSAELKTNPEEIIVSATQFHEEPVEAPAPAEGDAAPVVEGEAAPEGDDKKEEGN